MTDHSDQPARTATPAWTTPELIDLGSTGEVNGGVQANPDVSDDSFGAS